MTDLTTVTIDPVRFDPSMEKPEAEEAKTIAALEEEMAKIRETTYKDMGYAIRSVHAKSHGVLRGKMQVLPDLPAILSQGIFAKPATYPVAMRLSTLPGDILSDSVSTPRGLAVKVIGVEGTRLPGSENEEVQDFVLVNGPAFAAGNAKEFLANLKLLAATTDKAEGAKKVLSVINRGVEAVIEAFGLKSGLVTTLGGQPETHILGETFYSQVPLLYGDYIAKVCVAPVAPDLKALTGQKVDLAGKPNGLREAVQDYFRLHGGEWVVRVQLCTDLDAMPIEKASVVWPEDKCPYLPVARITAAPQDSWSPESVKEIDEALAFGPWHGIAGHRPLGSIMRARHAAYNQSADFRSSRNGCPIHFLRRDKAA